MKKRYIILFFVLLFGIIFWILAQEASNSITIPNSQQPTGGIDINLKPSPQAPEKAQKDDMIIVDTPLPEAQVHSPLVIKGRARGGWYFEASFPVVLTDWDGKIIAEGHAQADGEWMTSDYVPFTAILTYTNDNVNRTGYLILKKDNPSGEAKNDNSLEIKVQL